MNTPHVSDALPPILRELEKALLKFPSWPTDPLHAVAVLGEEFGELTKEALQLCYEPHKSNTDSVRKEALQTAAMALRFVMSLDNYRFQPGSQHMQDNRKPCFKCAEPVSEPGGVYCDACVREG